MGRLLTIITTLTGGIGLGSALGYFVLVAASFAEGGGALVDFLVGKDDANFGVGFALVVIPYVLLIAHLALRIRVAGILLSRGETEAAERFARARLKAGLLRARKEATANRTALIRVALRRGDYDSAASLAAEAQLPRRGPERIAFFRWKLENALRRENLVEAKATISEAWPFSARGDEAAAFCACAGEVAIREGDQQSWLEWRDRAAYARPNSARLLLADGLAAARFSADADTCERLAERLEKPLTWLQDVPLGEGELAATLAALWTAAGKADAANRAVERDLPADARSEFVLAKWRDTAG